MDFLVLLTPSNSFESGRAAHVLSLVHTLLFSRSNHLNLSQHSAPFSPSYIVILSHLYYLLMPIALLSPEPPPPPRLVTYSYHRLTIANKHPLRYSRPFLREEQYGGFLTRTSEEK